MKINRRTTMHATVDLVPMIDVVFQLILFFLVSTTFALLPAVSVSLPSSTTAQGEDVRSLTITVQENGSMWFNDEQVTYEQLDAKLASMNVSIEERSSYPVRFEADENVRNGTIVRIFDVLRKNSFTAVNLRTASAGE